MSTSSSAPIAKPAGIVNLYKPVGKSSAQYVYRLRHFFQIRKVGHAGSLDPFADGVLLGCVGAGTSLVEKMADLPKVYRTTLRLGVTNETFDTERGFEPVMDAVAPSQAMVEQALASLVGEIDQVPPVFSAVKIGGVPSYRLAKRGRAVEKPSKRVRIDCIVVENYEWPALRLKIDCGRGTYIRAIARDVGVLLGCGACCETLSRLAVGPFCIEESVRLETASPEDVRSSLKSVGDVLDLIGKTADQSFQAQ